MSPRDRRALLLGGTVAAASVLGLRLGPWGVRMLRERQAALEASASRLDRMRADTGSGARLEDSGAVIRRRMAALAPALLVGGTAGEAGADLGARLAAVASRHRVRVSRIDVASEPTGTIGLQPILIRAELESDTRGLFALLDALSREDAVLVVDSLRTAVADAHVGGEQPELLRTDLTLRGWWLKAEGAR